MDISVLLARFLGLFIVVVGVGLLLNIKQYQVILDGYSRDKSLVFLTGIITFVAGLAIVNFHNLWIADWRLSITLLGWLILVKGVLLIVFPDLIDRATSIFANNFKWVVIPWSMMIGFGLFLVMKGYL